MNAPPANGSATAAAVIAAALANNSNGNGKRRFADPEYIAISEFLSSVGEVDDHDANNANNTNGSQTAAEAYAAAQQQKRPRVTAASTASAARGTRRAATATTPRDAVMPRARGMQRWSTGGAWSSVSYSHNGCFVAPQELTRITVLRRGTSRVNWSSVA